jgi:hypothetical protein
MPRDAARPDGDRPAPVSVGGQAAGAIGNVAGDARDSGRQSWVIPTAVIALLIALYFVGSYAIHRWREHEAERAWRKFASDGPPLGFLYCRYAWLDGALYYMLRPARWTERHLGLNKGISHFRDYDPALFQPHTEADTHRP